MSYLAVWMKALAGRQIADSFAGETWGAHHLDDVESRPGDVIAQHLYLFEGAEWGKSINIWICADCVQTKCYQVGGSGQEQAQGLVSNEICWAASVFFFYLTVEGIIIEACIILNMNLSSQKC